MPRKTELPPLELTDEHKATLLAQAGSKTASARVVQRSQLLLSYHAGENVSRIAKKVRMSRLRVYYWIKRALAIGPIEGILDQPHQPFASKMTMEAKLWLVDLACRKPCDLGGAAELWSISSLAEYCRLMAPKAGHPCLGSASKSTVHRILNERDIKPHKIKYYLEKRDPEFDAKKAEVLIAYMEVNAANKQERGPFESPDMVTVAVDEKPGAQALEAVGKELPPVPGEHQAQGRDYEYKRHGTVSILAGLDLNTGHVHALVEDRHRSQEFIGLLRSIDEFYPAKCKIRLILDNHSAHTSKETMAWLGTRPGRFEYVHTPVHGSWLNLAESLFSKMSRTFLRGMRVKSIAELKARILKGVAEMNQSPVIFRWKAFDLD